MKVHLSLFPLFESPIAAKKPETYLKLHGQHFDLSVTAFVVFIYLGVLVQCKFVLWGEQITGPDSLA